MIHFILALVLLVLFGKLLTEVMERIGLVSVLANFTVGLVFGVSMLALIDAGDPIIVAFAEVGAILLLFIAGYEESDLGFMIKREKKILTVALFGLAAGIFSLLIFGHNVLGLLPLETLFFAIAFAVTDIAVAAKVILSTRKLKEDSSKTLLGIAVVDTVLGIIVLALAVAANSASIFEMLWVLGGIIFFFAVTVLVYKFVPRLIKLATHMEAEAADFSAAFLVILFLAYMAEFLGLAMVLGAYFAGLILQRSPELRARDFSQKIKAMAYGFFVPVFFAWMGLQTDLSTLGEFWAVSLLIVAVAVLPKLVAILLASMGTGSNFREALVYGIGLSAKGADNLIVLTIGISMGVFATTGMILSAMAVAILLSILFSTISLRLLLR